MSISTADAPDVSRQAFARLWKALLLLDHAKADYVLPQGPVLVPARSPSSSWMAARGLFGHGCPRSASKKEEAPF